jgi:isoleucyl-tRNA synthetase
LTLHKEYEAKEIEVFKEIFLNGYIYKGVKPIYWCPHCETALAEAEIEYHDHTSPSIYVKFQLMSSLENISEDLHEKLSAYADAIYFVIWTTTPWTLPANVAISLHPDYFYEFVLAKDKGEVYILVKELREKALAEMGIKEYEILGEVKGSKLEYEKAQHPFIDRESLIILGEHVTTEQGTGAVHTAPGHGVEDFVVGQKYNLPVISPLDDKGYFTVDGGFLHGVFYKDANQKILDLLKETEYLLGTDKIDHSYPHCWRCKSPIVFRATPQWFIKVEESDIREKALKATDEVKWVPEWGKNRIQSMLEERPDWCISRQRVWGVPIPVFYCRKCGHELINEDTLNAVIDLFSRVGSDAWFREDADNIIPEGTTCPHCGHNSFKKEKDILDVWFDSGVSHRSVLETFEGLEWPADLYLEGSDQHRGWFQTSLLTSIASRGKPPYRQVLTHGFTVDGNGKKMSKSQGNVIAPQKLIQSYGADILRLWVSSVDYREDVRLSDKIIKQIVDAYRKIRNTVRFILGNISDFNPEEKIEYQFTNLDKWAYLKYKQLLERVRGYYETYQFYKIYHEIHYFCTVVLSNSYLDILKDRLYTYPKNHPLRRTSQKILFEILRGITIMFSPILSFTGEEIWSKLEFSSKPESVFLADWPEYEPIFEVEDGWLDKMEEVMKVREKCQKGLERARGELKIIGHSLDSKIEVYLKDESVQKNLHSLVDDQQFREIMIVSQVKFVNNIEDFSDEITYEDEEIAIVVKKAEGEKCPRCWKYADLKVVEDGVKVCPTCYEFLQ